MMKQLSCFTIICIGFICISGISAWSMTSQESVKTPETLYKTGMKYLENEQEAKQFLELFPNSKYASTVKEMLKKTQDALNEGEQTGTPNGLQNPE